MWFKLPALEIGKEEWILSKSSSYVEMIREGVR